MAKAQTDKRLAWIPSTAAAVLVLLAGLLLPGWITRLENGVYDYAVRHSSAAPDRDLAVIAVDDESLRQLGNWPWSLSVHAKLLDRLRDVQSGAVAFTMPMDETQSAAGLKQLNAALELLRSEEIAKSPQGKQLRALLDSTVADLDQNTALGTAIRKHGDVLMPIDAQVVRAKANAAQSQQLSSEQLASLPSSSFLAADPYLLESAPIAAAIHLPSIKADAHAYAHTALTADSGNVVRLDTAALRVDDKLVPSMSAAIAAALRKLDPSQITVDDEGVLSVANNSVRLSSELQWHPFAYPAVGPRAITQFSYWKVLSGEVPAAELRDKTLVVGLTSADLVPQVFSAGGDQMAPVQVIANAASSLAEGQYIRQPGWAKAIEVLTLAGVLLLCIRVIPGLRAPYGVSVGTLLAVAVLATELAAILLASIWIQLLLPALALLTASLAVGGRQLIRRLGSPRGTASDAVENLRMLGLTFQGQGQLELAYETFRRCPDDTQVLDLLYGLGQDYERRRQFNKAAEVYTHVASVDGNYKDVGQRRDRMKRANVVQIAQAGTPTRASSRPAAFSEPLTEPAPVATRHPPKVSGAKQTLGRYEIERELGKGAMGVVYLGRDPKINRVVAIKAIALAEEFAEEDLADARARFFREAEMAGRLNHPGIVTVYDAGEDSGLAFIAMEYLRGEHLSHYAEPIHLLPVARVLALAARVADALDYAHKQNVVHRDIKPANIMFNKDTDELKITDFGIARLTDTSRTKTGIVLGTPSFMSPEQLEGRPLDGRSDLFSLAITLYQLLTGQLPFRADSMTRLMQKIATEDHVPLRSLRPELPEMAEQIVTRGLAKSAVDRYQTGAEMAAALRACIRLTTRREAIVR